MRTADEAGSQPKWRRQALAVLLLGALVVVLSSFPARGEAPSDEAHDLVVATYNLNFGVAGDPSTLDAIADLDADVILLQETNALWEQSIRERLQDEYPHQHWHSVFDYPAGGSAILSRHPLSEFTISPSAIGWFAAVSAIVYTPHGEIQVLGVHLKPPVSDSGSLVLGYFSTPPERAREMRAHLATLRRSDLPTVIAGDFNEESGGGLAVAEQEGYRDAVQRFAPEQNTWRWQVGPIPLRQQLDHLLHDARLECLGVEIREVGRSDHLPIVARFRMR